jgi:hypothetical protein
MVKVQVYLRVREQKSKCITEEENKRARELEEQDS